MKLSIRVDFIPMVCKNTSQMFYTSTGINSILQEKCNTHVNRVKWMIMSRT